MDTQRNEPDALIAFACPGCGHAMKARASYGGRATRCPKCQASVTVPAPEARQTAAKRSSAGRLVAVGAGLLLLAGCVALAWVLMRGKDDVDDLALVPANAQGVVRVNVDALWGTVAVQKAAEKYARDNPGEPDLARRMEAETGLKPDQIERVTVVIANAARRQGWAIVKTKRPYNAEEIREHVHAAPLSRGPADVVGFDAQEPHAFAAISPRVFVLGSDEGDIYRALELLRTPEVQGRLGPVIERCRGTDHVVFGYNPAEGRIDAGKFGVDLSALNDVDVFLGTLDVGEQAELEVRARTESEAKAERLNVAASGWLRMATRGLALAQFMPGEQGKQAGRISKLLGAVKLSLDKKDFVLTLKADSDPLLAQLLGVIP